MTRRHRLASIVVSSYNYGRYVGEAIESALSQTYPHKEVIVVDDGSRDHSREVIARYGDRVRPVLKANGGQASAFNAGFAVSRGQVVVFLDSDDILLPEALAEAMRRFDSETAKVHWPLLEVDAHGEKTGVLIPGHPLSEGDLREGVLEAGSEGYGWPPTSGNAWARRFLERVLPMPEAEWRTSPDYYLAGLAPLYGLVRAVPAPMGHWRNHGDNNTWRDARDQRIATMLTRIDNVVGTLAVHARERGLAIDEQACKAVSWWSWLDQLRAATEQLETLIGPEDPYILIDERWWQTEEFAPVGRPLPFLERDGQDWGAPPDDATAISELERMRRAGAKYIVFARPALWWLDHYAAFLGYLRTTFPCRIDNDLLVAFDLRRGLEPGQAARPARCGVGGEG